MRDGLKRHTVILVPRETQHAADPARPVPFRPRGQAAAATSLACVHRHLVAALYQAIHVPAVQGHGNREYLAVFSGTESIRDSPRVPTDAASAKRHFALRHDLSRGIRDDDLRLQRDIPLIGRRRGMLDRLFVLRILQADDQQVAHRIVNPRRNRYLLPRRNAVRRQRPLENDLWLVALIEKARPIGGNLDEEHRRPVRLVLLRGEFIGSDGQTEGPHA